MSDYCDDCEELATGIHYMVPRFIPGGHYLCEGCYQKWKAKTEVLVRLPRELVAKMDKCGPSREGCIEAALTVWLERKEQ